MGLHPWFIIFLEFLPDHNMPETENLKRAGLKTTQPRLKILAILENSAVRHVSAEDVYKLLLEQNEEIGLATVYRVLTQLPNVDAGIESVRRFDRWPQEWLILLRCGRSRSVSTVLRQESATLYLLWFSYPGGILGDRNLGQLDHHQRRT